MAVDLLIPVIVVFLMVATGTGVQVSQFRLVLAFPLALLGGTIAQVLLLPLVALLLIWISDPAPELAAGLVLVAASPGGALSNVYCYLGRLDVSLSVMLTTLSTLLSFAALPLVLAVSLPVIGPAGGDAIPLGEMMMRLVIFLLLPVAVGMAIRRYAAGLVERSAARLRAVGLALLVLLIGLIVLDQWQTVMAIYRESALLGGLFTCVAAVIGWLVGALLGRDPDDRYVFSIEFAIRNLGAAALVASATLGRPEFLAFGALFVVVQFPLVLLLLRFRRFRGLLQAG